MVWRPWARVTDTLCICREGVNVKGNQQGYSVERSNISMMGMRRVGWANCAPMRRAVGAAWMPPEQKNAPAWTRARFFTFPPPAAPGAVPPPFERLMRAVGPERSNAERREQSQPMRTERGEAPRQGGRDNVLPTVRRRMAMSCGRARPWAGGLRRFLVLQTGLMTEQSITKRITHSFTCAAR